MAYRQPKVPEYREGDGVGRYMKQLILFLKDFTGAAWTANNQRIGEIRQLQSRMEEMETQLKALRSIPGETEGA